MGITTIRSLQRYIKRHSDFSGKTINSVIIALGYQPNDATLKDFKELSGIFKDCSEYGAYIGFTGFSYYSDTVKFYMKHQKNIVCHLEEEAAKLETDAISYVLNLDYFANNDNPPTPSKVGKALWNKKLSRTGFYELYNGLAWYTLEEVSRIWNEYLITKPAVKAKISA